MNRKEKRSFFRNIKKVKNLRKKHAGKYEGTKGCMAFGSDKNKFLGDYKTLHVVPRSKRNTISCDKNGILVI